ncbi:H-NS histone family protein [Burkholderia pyrrocinia]|uniref:H-NS histone family protein n=1 Tax=Burkholderia pyrrocinia TaxID=60550 RepID=UPI00158837FD|nr:H-NS histone family protein [Burkholderia pyrrocinia]
MSTYKELLARKAEIDIEIERIRNQERDSVISEIRQRMADYKITVEDISGKGLSKPPRRPVPVKYLNPKTGEKWSGRGRAPAWIANVADRNVFLV